MHPLTMSIVRRQPPNKQLVMLVLISCSIFILIACESRTTNQPVDNQDKSQNLEPTAERLLVLPTAVVQVQSSINAESTQDPGTTPALKMVSIANHHQWSELLEKSLSVLSLSTSGWNWQLVDSAADLGIETDAAGYPFATTPIALTVDFTSSLESISLEEARNFMITDNDQVIVMPWNNVTPERKSLEIDGHRPADRDYPLRQTWVVTFRPGFEEAAAELATTLKQNIEEEIVVKIAAVGDIMLDRALGYAISQGNIEFPFSLVAPTLQGADITVGNLESALGSAGQPEHKSYTFQAPSAAADSLSSAGFDILNLANNHAMDFGTEALLEGIDLLNNKGILTIGAGSNDDMARNPAVIVANGLRVAFLGYVDVPVEVAGFDTRDWQATETAAGLAWAEPQQIQEDVESAREDADVVIVILHSGHEYIEAPTGNQVQAARAAVDAGAALVIGHHTHLLQGIEFYGDGVISYGLGNFAFEIDGDPSTVIFEIWLDRFGVRELNLVPAIIQFGGQPRLATAGEALSISQRVYELSNLLNSQ